MTQSFSQRQEETQWDILNIVSEHHPTIRKYINRDDAVQVEGHTKAVIKSNIMQLMEIPEEKLTDDFLHGAHIMEMVYVTAIHRYFCELMECTVEDMDLIFGVDDTNKAFLDIELPEPPQDDDSEKEPTPDAPSPVEDVKKDLLN